MKQALTIGIIGDYNPRNPSHVATDAALHHAGRALAVPIDLTWLPTPSLDDPRSTVPLHGFDGLWCSPGSPYASMQGALVAIRFARERNWPFFAT